MARQKCSRTLIIACSIVVLAAAVAAFRLRDDEADAKSTKTHAPTTKCHACEVDSASRRGSVQVPWATKAPYAKTQKDPLKKPVLHVELNDQGPRAVRSNFVRDHSDDRVEAFKIKKYSGQNKVVKSAQSKNDKFSGDAEDDEDSENESDYQKPSHQANIKSVTSAVKKYHDKKIQSAATSYQYADKKSSKNNVRDGESDEDDNDTLEESDADDEEDDEDDENGINDEVSENESNDDGASNTDDDMKSDDDGDDDDDDDTNAEDNSNGASDEGSDGDGDSENDNYNNNGSDKDDNSDIENNEDEEEDSDDDIEYKFKDKGQHDDKGTSKLNTHNVINKQFSKSGNGIQTVEDDSDSNGDEGYDDDGDEDNSDDDDDEFVKNSIGQKSIKIVTKHPVAATASKLAKNEKVNKDKPLGINKFASLTFDDDEDSDEDDIEANMRSLLLKLQKKKGSEVTHAKDASKKINILDPLKISTIPIAKDKIEKSTNVDNLLVLKKRSDLNLQNRTKNDINEFLKHSSEPTKRTKPNLPSKMDEGKDFARRSDIETKERKAGMKSSEKIDDKLKSTETKSKEKKDIKIKDEHKVVVPITEPKKKEVAPRKDSEKVKKEEKFIEKSVPKIDKTKLASEKDIKQVRKDNKSDLKAKKSSVDTKSHGVSKAHGTREAISRKTILESNFEDFYTFLPSFAPNYSRIHNPECRRHGQILMRQLHGAKLWALQMVDASAKVPSGLLRGNGNQLGDFDECVGARARVRLDTGTTVRVRGQYCLAHIDVTAVKDDLRLPVHLLRGRDFIRSTNDDPGHFIPRFTSLRWGVCLPAACDAKDAEFAVRDALRHYDATPAMKIEVRVRPSDCHHKHELAPAQALGDIPTVASLIGITAIAVIAIIATVKDLWNHKPSTGAESEDQKSEDKAGEETHEDEENEMSETRISNEEDKNQTDEELAPKSNQKSSLWDFSILQTWRKLTADTGDEDVGCVYGIRALCAIALYSSHKVITLGMTPYVNRIELTELANSWFSVIFRNAVLYTDTYLLLSGLLAAYHMAGDFIATGDMSWFKKYIARYIRLTPAMAAVMGATLLMEYVGNGPQWGVVKENANLCRENMWRNFLYIHNFYNFEEMCAPQTHHLALDMQLTLLAGPLVWLMMNKVTFAAVTFAVLHAFSAWVRYSASIEHNLSIVVYHGATTGQLLRTANFSYILPHHRATPYLAGITLGVLLRQYVKDVKLSKLVLIPGWLLCIYFGVWSYYAPSHMAYRDYQYEATEMALYACLSSIAWALCLSWILFVCSTDNAGPLGTLLCSYPLVLLSRLSYCLYLCQFLVFFYNIGSSRTSQEFSVMSSINISEVLAVILVSTTFALLFDIPAQSLKKIVTSLQLGAKSSAEEVENNDDQEREPAEANENDDVTENIEYEADARDENSELVDIVEETEDDPHAIDEYLGEEYEEEYEDEEYEPQKVLIEDDEDIIIEEEEEEELDPIEISSNEGARGYNDDLRQWRGRYISQYQDENDEEDDLNDWELTNDEDRAKK